MAPARAESPQGVNDRYKITAEEMSACGSDAIALCSSAYPDEEKLLSCMKYEQGELERDLPAGVRGRDPPAPPLKARLLEAEPGGRSRAASNIRW